MKRQPEELRPCRKLFPSRLRMKAHASSVILMSLGIPTGFPPHQAMGGSKVPQKQLSVSKWGNREEMRDCHGIANLRARLGNEHSCLSGRGGRCARHTFFAKPSWRAWHACQPVRQAPGADHPRGYRRTKPRHTRRYKSAPRKLASRKRFPRNKKGARPGPLFFLNSLELRRS